MLAKGCQEHKGCTPTQGADPDAAGVRALAAYKNFLILWKDNHPHLQARESLARQATVRALKLPWVEVLLGVLQMRQLG